MSYNSSQVYASPISAPPFTYYRDRGLEVNGHARCANDRLYALLTYTDPGPVLTKKGKPRVHQPTPHKDPTAAFYEAQLVHYGLKPVKTKGPAKRALLAAFEANNGTLIIPENIVRLEHDLAAQFEVKNAAAGKEYYAKKERENAAEELKRQKRKREKEDLVAEFRKTTSKKAKLNKKSPPLPVVERCGSYRIVAPEVSDGWDCPDPLVLRLALSLTGAHLWGSFDFGDVVGTLRSRSVLTAADRTVKFHWRGRETGEGQTTYGQENIAEFTFLGQGKFSGTMYWDCVGTFTVMGRLKFGPSLIHDLSDQVQKWKGQYWSINDANYEAESIGRWGTWTWNRGLEEREPNSDSDGCSPAVHESQDDEEDEDEDEDEDEEGGEEGGEEGDDDDETNGTDEDESVVDGIDPYPESITEST